MKINPDFNGLFGKKEIQILRKRPMCWAAIGFLLIISVFLWGRSYEDVLYQNENEKVFLEGKITEKQYKESSYGGYWQITLKNVRVWKEPLNRMETPEGKYLCQVSAQEGIEFKIGQKVVLEGNYVAWEAPSNPGQFNLGKYYCSQGILGQFRKCKVIKQGSSFSEFLENMWQFRQDVCTFLIQELGERDGSLICAMLLGEKSSLDEDNKNLYQRNGISHILAISGLHLSLLGAGVVRCLKTIVGGNKRVAASAIVIMSLYCVFTGNSISTIRATIMFALSLIAGMIGRSYDSLSALGLAAILQLFMNPYVLNNSGFLLSFLAVIGVTFVAPRLQEILGAKSKTAKSLCISLSASVTTLPVLLWNYGTYPWYSVFLNLLILPPMSVLLLLAIVLVVLWGLAKYTMLSLAFGILAVVKNCAVMGIKLILEYFEVCCRLFEKIPLADGYIGSPSVWQIVIYIGLVAAALSEMVKHSAMGRKMILLSAISILTMNTNFGIEVTMLDVGQGDGVVIRSDSGNIYVSDCGSSSVSLIGKYRLLPFLKHKGYGKIKGIFISHLDEDHMNGIVELLELAPVEKIEIEYLFLPESVLGIEEDRKIIEELQSLTKENSTELVYLSQGDRILDGNMNFYCLYPEGNIGKREDERIENESQMIPDTSPGGEMEKKKAGSTSENRNNQSLVLLLQYKDFEMLLTGDVEKAGERVVAEYINQLGFTNVGGDYRDNTEKEIYNRKNLGQEHEDGNEKMDVLKVAHHGSSGSSCEELLEVLNPKLSLISCGKNNKSTMGSIQFNDTNSVKMA